MNEFRLEPGGRIEVSKRRPKIMLANFTEQGTWFSVEFRNGNYLIARVPRPDSIEEPTFKRTQEYKSDPI